MEASVLFFDIDGTLVDAKNRLPDSAAAAIRAADAAGHICVVNTGRPYPHIVDCVRELPFAGYVCGCGQEILYRGRVLRRMTLTPAESARVIRLARACRTDLYLEGQEGLWVDFYSHPMPELVARELDKFRRRGLHDERDILAPDFVFDKCCAWREPDSDMERFTAGTADLFAPIDCGQYLEMVRRGCSKLTGIREFLKLTGQENAVTYAFGDSSNDLPMLRAADHSAVIGSRCADACACAEFVAPPLEEDGLAAALRHFGLC